MWVRSLGGKILWGRKWQPTPVFLPGESPWTEETGGLQSMGSQSQTRLSDFHLTDLGAKGGHLGMESHMHMCVLSHA